MRQINSLWKETSIDSGHKPTKTPLPRKSARVRLNTDIILRRAGHPNYRTKIYDLSPHGCKVEFVDRPLLNELVWVKIEGLEALDAVVCWVEGHAVGLEFQRAIHPAVFEMLVKRVAS